MGGSWIFVHGSHSLGVGRERTLEKESVEIFREFSSRTEGLVLAWPLPSSTFRVLAKPTKNTTVGGRPKQPPPNNAMAVTRIHNGELRSGADFLVGKKRATKKSRPSSVRGRIEEGRKGSPLSGSAVSQGPLSTRLPAARREGGRQSGARSECGDVKATRQKERKNDDEVGSNGKPESEIVSL